MPEKTPESEEVAFSQWEQEYDSWKRKNDFVERAKEFGQNILVACGRSWMSPYFIFDPQINTTSKSL